MLSLRRREFVEAAEGLGASNWRLLWSEILPNVTTTVIVFIPIMIALAMLTEAALSFLSIGVQPPDASWGTIINDGQGLLYTTTRRRARARDRDRAHGARAERVRRRHPRRARPARQAPGLRLMARFILFRTASMIFVLFAISVLVFLIFFATPGVDPAARIAGREADQQTLQTGAPRLRARQAEAGPVRDPDEEALHHA